MMRSQTVFDSSKILKNREIFKAIRLKFKLYANFRFIKAFPEASRLIKA